MHLLVQYVTLVEVVPDSFDVSEDYRVDIVFVDELVKYGYRK